MSALIAQSQHLVAFTGAGVSTLSGLPDFRGRNGFYSNPENQRVFDFDEICRRVNVGDIPPRCAWTIWKRRFARKLGKRTISAFEGRRLSFGGLR